MITSEQIQAATGDELSRLAGEVLGYGYWHTDDAYFSSRCYHINGVLEQVDERKCVKCEQVFQKFLFHRPDFKVLQSWRSKKCTVGCPIPLTWPEAMKWRDWAVKEYGSNKFRDAMVEIYMAMVPPSETAGAKRWSFQAKIRYTFYHIVISGEPEHYIKAACLCKIGGE